MNLSRAGLVICFLVVFLGSLVLEFHLELTPKLKLWLSINLFDLIGAISLNTLPNGEQRSFLQRFEKRSVFKDAFGFNFFLMGL